MSYAPKLLRGIRNLWIPIALVAGAAATITLVVGQTVAPNIPAINLSADPLYAASSGDKPTMALALSVEFPTVGAQYVASPGANTDSTYTNTREYLGYYDSESCYNYNNSPTETPETGLTAADYKRFDRTGAATNRICSDAFSGNFLNWSSNSAIDMLRLALSGGDRYIDTTGLTVLQRALIPDGDPVCMWNSGNFPAKQLQKDGNSAGTYWGAIPIAMRTQANGSDVWVANTLNRIYFGTSNTGGCGNTSAYILGSPPPPPAFGPIINRYLARTTAQAAFGGVECASENGTCSFTGIKEVLYGAQGTSNTNGGWIAFPASGGVACSNNFSGAFIDPAPGTGKKCFIRNYTGTWTPSTPVGQINSDGFFYSRVQVCNMTSGVLQDVRDYGLCKRYPNGTYKPTGSIQKYSDQLRVAAFGYLMDQTQSSNTGTPGRYGGVLRAPMKFVGTKTYDESGVENTPTGGNPKAEWNATTGIFVANPDADTTQTTPISGVINYLNKFGRTGPNPGRYKIYDPVGELYGESLRYLQGLQPTAAAVSSITTAMYDGFPASSVWVDPYGGARTSASDYSCLKSNIVVVGDVNTHDSNRLLTRTTDLANNLPNFSDTGWKGVVTKFEANNSGTYVDGQGTTRNISNPNAANTSSQSVSTGYQVLTGQAYWAHTHDIRGSDWTAGTGPALQRRGLRVKSYFFDVNENASSNDAAYRKNRNQFFTAAKYGGFESDASNIGGKPYNTYGNPFKRQDGTDDNNVWQDAANPTEAGSFYLQSSARSVLNAFDSIFSRAASAARSIAGTAVASKNITSAGTLLYQSSFDTSTWSGDVLAFPLTLGTGNSLSVGSTTTWSASTRLTAMATPATTRNIVVGKSGASSNPVATSFTWAAIEQGLKDKLNKPSQISVADGMGEQRLNYLRGDRSQEGTFRVRSSILGDIVNSGVVYLGAPVAPSGATAGFAAFRTANASRTPAVFVGANDGMMHAFNANTGDELFAFIPSAMGNKLSLLTNTTYNNNHQSFVDASPVVAEAKVGSGDTAADWKSVLVSGMGGGAPGVFALDVTSSTAFSASNAMWEFTRTDDADMGLVVGRPRIIKLRTSQPGASPATFRYFAAVASGVNNYVSFDGLFSTTGSPALFLLALDKAAGTGWTLGTNYYKVLLPTDTLLKASNPTGLINFRPAVNSTNGETQQIYMGDLHGKLWKLDFTSPSLTGPSDWNINKLSFYNKGTSALPVPYPLFTAQTSAGGLQTITMAPLLAAGPVINGLSTTIVGFGTGKYLETTDKTSTNQNTFYAIYDNGTTTADNSPASNSVITGRGRLQPGVVDTTALTVTVPSFRFGRPTTNTSTATPPVKAGYYFDLPFSGERLINDGVINGNFFLVSSLIPASSGAAGSCSAAGGGGNAYSINIDTGTAGYQRSAVGLLGDSISIVVSVTSTPTTSTGKGETTVVTKTLTTGSSGSGSSTGVDLSEIQPPYPSKRMSWRQISNYKDLFNTPLP
ncbi:MAG: pilus assembly protein [Polaromonas sp.]